MPNSLHMRRNATVIVFILAVCFSSIAAPVRADTLDKDISKFFSGTGNLLYLGAGTLLPLATDGKAGKTHTLRALDALAVTAIATYGLKNLTHEKRPEGDAHDSFPSGHASAAFAVAAVQSHFHPREAPYWYAGATLISLSRISLRRHYGHDVLFGAALGYGMARLELSAPHGLLLSPFIPRSGNGMGLQVGTSF